MTKVKGTQLGQGIGVPLRCRVDASDPRHPLGRRLEMHVAGQPPICFSHRPQCADPKGHSPPPRHSNHSTLAAPLPDRGHVATSQYWQISVYIFLRGLGQQASSLRKWERIKV